MVSVAKVKIICDIVKKAEEKPVTQILSHRLFHLSSILYAYLFTWKRFQPSFK